MIYNPDHAKKRLSPRKRGLLKQVLSRKGLSPRGRMLCSMGYLQANGDWKSLTGILDLFIANEDDFREAYETLLQGYLFCGYPRAIESFFCLNEVLNSKGGFFLEGLIPRSFEDSAELLDRGNSLSRKIHKDKSQKIKNKIGDICPDLGYLMIAEGYGHVLSRDGLDLKNRELAVIASLISLKAYRQLHSHIRGARNVGCHDLEIYEAIITGMVWINPGKVRKAVELWSKITGRRSPDSIDNNIFSRV